MSYYETQRNALGDGSRYAVKLQNRDGGRSATARGETHWMDATADQVERIMAILAENDTIYTIQPEDVGKRTLYAFGKPWPVVDFMGVIQTRDVGKRVVRCTNAAEDYEFLQVENDSQLAARTTT